MGRRVRRSFMKAEDLIQIIGADFYTGVPDSQLKALCDYLMVKYGIDEQHHIIAANEGNCVALAAGYYLATVKYLWYICKIQVKEISLILWYHC